MSDCASLSSSQGGDAWYATVAVYGRAGDVASRVGDVASVWLRAASHDAPAGPHGAWVWRGGAWRAGAWHGALAALPWSASLCGALQALVTLLWHRALLDTLSGAFQRLLGRLCLVQAPEAGPARRIPYGVAIALGSFWAMWWEHSNP